MPSGVKDIQLLELKDTISQLNKTISTQNELISSLQKMLEERNAKDSEKDLLIANLQSQLAYLKNKVFGSTSEIRHDQLDGQLRRYVFCPNKTLSGPKRCRNGRNARLGKACECGTFSMPL